VTGLETIGHARRARQPLDSVAAYASASENRDAEVIEAGEKPSAAGPRASSGSRYRS